jgi:2'-5' RNA ligase
VIYFEPSLEVEKAIIATRETIKDSIVRVSDKPIHGTLMATRISPYYERYFLDRLPLLRCDRFQVSLEDVALFDNDKLVVRVQKNSGLDQLHRSVFDAVKKFIPREEIKPLSEKYVDDPARVKVYEELGSPYCGEFYNPHLTIAQVDPLIMNTLQEESLPGLSGLQFTVDKFSVYRVEKDNYDILGYFFLR